jgi:hypothetical protein
VEQLQVKETRREILDVFIAYFKILCISNWDYGRVQQLDSMERQE